MSKFKPGDRVRVGILKGTVIAVYENNVWFKEDGGVWCCMYPFKSLKKLKPKKKKQEFWAGRKYSTERFRLFSQKENIFNEITHKTEDTSHWEWFKVREV